MDIYTIRRALLTGKTIYDLPLRVTFYARVSTEKDAQLHSLSAQVSYYTEFIRRCSMWQFAEGYVDAGISGTSAEKREQFLHMIEDARQHRFDFIVTKEISRFSRNTLDSIQYTQELLHCGVGVLFQSDNINTLLPDAELRLTILSSIAQDEVRKISERVRFGFQRAIEKGVVLGSNRIWGYRKQDGALVIQEEEAAIVRLIFDLYANQNLGIRSIAAHLSERGIQNSGGNAFSFSTIRGILKNPKYKGYYCGRKSSKIDYKCRDIKHFSPEEWVVYKDEAHVPPIVSEALWDKANCILAQRSQKQSAADKTSYQNKYPYSGKILCGIHKAPYYRGVYRCSGGEKEVWQCREYAKSGKKGCTSPVVYTTELDTVLRQMVGDSDGFRQDLIRECLDIYTAAQAADPAQAALTRCKTNMEDIVRRKDKLLDLSVNGHISDEEFRLRNDRFNAELQTLEQKRCALEQALTQIQPLPYSALEQALQQELAFPDGFSIGITNALLDHIEVYSTACKHEVQLRVYWNTTPETQTYCIRRTRGKPSVCIRQYT